MENFENFKETILKSYNSNKIALHMVERAIDENGCDDRGLCDPSGSFEQGWNNALEFVMNLLKISHE